MEDFNELKIFYKNFLDMCCATGLKFFETGSREDYWNWWDNLSRKNSHIHTSSGASKMVLWEDELPYVIKIPFLDGRTDYRDYCRVELKNYKVLKDFPEIIPCFAWIDYLFEYKGFPVYIMEKVDCDEDGIESAAYDSTLLRYCEEENLVEGSDDYKEKIADFSDSFFSLWDGIEKMETLLIENWGHLIVEKFQDFCYEYNINDLHSANWGYRGSELVVIDYSGI